MTTVHISYVYIPYKECLALYVINYKQANTRHSLDFLKVRISFPASLRNTDFSNLQRAKFTDPEMGHWHSNQSASGIHSAGGEGGVCYFVYINLQIYYRKLRDWIIGSIFYIYSLLLYQISQCKGLLVMLLNMVWTNLGTRIFGIINDMQSKLILLGKMYFCARQPDQERVSYSRLLLLFSIIRSMAKG